MVSVGIYLTLAIIQNIRQLSRYYHFASLYITCFIIIIGAEINAIIHQRHVIKGKTPEEAALEHDDNNQNHYNENTTYEYTMTRLQQPKKQIMK